MICKKSLISFHVIYSGFQYNRLECNCDLADALDDLNRTTVSILGTCKHKKEQTKEQLTSFVSKTKLGEYGVFLRLLKYSPM